MTTVQVAQLRLRRGRGKRKPIEVSRFKWGTKGFADNPVCCGNYTYKLFISRHQKAVHVGYYCYNCKRVHPLEKDGYE